MSFKIGSLFDGSGGFPLAASLCGGTPVWASEVEPYPIAVTSSRFPSMRHLGNVSKVNGAEIEPVDVITFGSPCQDLSVAGKRAGLKHEANGDEETTRSGLFMEAVRIIREMREATNGVYPAFAIWENVPGAFSSNGGEDFRIVIEELIKICEPDSIVPPPAKGKWPYADAYMGDGWSLAYRVFDAQYWGVPQRRRRIYLVLDLRGKCAWKVLFERKGLRGYFTEGRAPWQTITGDAENSPAPDDRAGDGSKVIANYIIAIDQQGGKGGANYAVNVMPTLCSDSHGTPHGVAYTFDPSPAKNQEGIAVVEPVAFPTTTAYSIENHPADSRVSIDESGKVQTLTSRMGTGGGNTPMVMEKQSFVEKEPCYIIRRLTPTECARLQGFPDTWGHPDQKETLTDEEYKFWLDVRNAHAEINGKAVKEYTREQMLTYYNKLHTDSSEYKLWGNGIALPNALYVMQGISDQLTERDAI